jgi:hypothetical protein
MHIGLLCSPRVLILCSLQLSAGVRPKTHTLWLFEGQTKQASIVSISHVLRIQYAELRYIWLFEIATLARHVDFRAMESNVQYNHLSHHLKYSNTIIYDVYFECEI